MSSCLLNMTSYKYDNNSVATELIQLFFLGGGGKSKYFDQKNNTSLIWAVKTDKTYNLCPAKIEGHLVGFL